MLNMSTNFVDVYVLMRKVISMTAEKFDAELGKLIRVTVNSGVHPVTVLGLLAQHQFDLQEFIRNNAKATKEAFELAKGNSQGGG